MSDDVTARSGADGRMSEADAGVTALYGTAYDPMVRLATLLLRDQGRAEEVVQDALVAVHGRWSKLREPGKAEAYLRRSVVNKCRSEHRHRVVVAKHPPAPPGTAPSAEHEVVATSETDRVLASLDLLPRRQREVLVLRYWLDWPDADVAACLGISRGAVKSHASRGLAALRTRIGDPS